jgi:hypothetical protein
LTGLRLAGEGYAFLHLRSKHRTKF